MAEDQFAEQIIPGTFIRVQAEALISAGGISAGNIGIVGTAASGVGETHVLSDWEGAKETFGLYDALTGGTLNLNRSVEQLFRNGARTVYARGVAAGANKGDFTTAFAEIIKENVNILVAPELTTADATDVLKALVDSAEGDGKDVIAVIGGDGADATAVVAQAATAANKRLIVTTPGFQTFDSVAGADVTLGGNYSAAAVAGLISSLAVQSSPTNKALSGVTQLSEKYSYGELKQLVQGNVCALEDRRGIRVVRGVTTEGAAFAQITTRRITDYAKAGVRQVANPFIGRLNNQRVRAALQGAIDGFLATMLQDESLTNYTVSVTATRQDEIAGRAIVNIALQPTFSIDYIRVTMSLS